MSTVAKIMSKQPKTVGPAVSIVSAAKKEYWRGWVRCL